MDKIKPEIERSLKKAIKECKEGRTYIMSCQHFKGKGLFVCWECHVEDCKKWYKLGRLDERRKTFIRTPRRKTKTMDRKSKRIRRKSK